MDQQESWGLPQPNKPSKVAGHCADVSRYQHASGLGADPKNFRIESAVRNSTSGSAKID